ncbi:MAG: SBBP repeat-containing protein [Anaerolineae bacterium]|nr:SBBP repeat-containing protein [Anaerolineae bacterium]
MVPRRFRVSTLIAATVLIGIGLAALQPVRLLSAVVLPLEPASQVANADALYPSVPATVDPSLNWHTFLGSSGYDHGGGIAVDGSGNIYVAGDSDDTWGTPVRAYSGGGRDAFVARLGSDGSLIWHTFLGGDGRDSGYTIAVDGSGSVYVTGASWVSWGDPVRGYTGSVDAFVARLSNDGSLIWHTFLGGDGLDSGDGIAVDGSGNIYVTGYSLSAWGDPVRAYTGGEMDAFVARLDSDGSLIWNTFLGGDGLDSGNDIAVDGSGDVCVAGESDATWGSPLRAFTAGDSDDSNFDAFAAKLGGDGSLAWHTFLGGDDVDFGYGVAVDGTGSVYVAGASWVGWGDPVRGYTYRDPLCNEVYDGFVARLGNDGSLAWHTFLGNYGADLGYAIAVDGYGSVYVTGYSEVSWDNLGRPFTTDYGAFVAELGNDGGLIWSIFFGGASTWGSGIAVHGGGSIYVAGNSSSAAWGSPLRAHSGSNDVFVAQVTRRQGKIYLPVVFTSRP